MRIPADHVVEPSNPGSQYKTIYKPKVLANGVIELVEDGKEDLKEYIQSWRDITDMSYILKQMALGNTAVLNQSPGYYGDITKAPKSMQEAMQLMIDAESEFYKLPLDVRNQFNNSVYEWIATAGEEDWSKKMWPEKFVKEESEEKSDVS